MRPFFTKTATAALLCSPFVLQIAHASEWSGSYAAQGQCFCVGELPSGLSSRIVPTPIGGQTISQVCKRVGEGPGLLKTSGLFNYPVYKDSQCGHGPFAVGDEPVSASCAGSLDGDKKGCVPVGAKWNLSQTFGQMTAPAAAKPDSKDGTTAQSLMEKPIVSSTTVKSKIRQGKNSGEVKVLKATIIKSPSTAGSSFDPARLSSKAARSKTLESFKGKTITIEDQRYLQAHSAVSATGGESGSRIILDGVVYLREDAKLDMADLYQDQTEKNTAKVPSAKASAKASGNASGKLPKVVNAKTDTKLIEKPSVSNGNRSDDSLLPDSQSVAKANRLREQQVQKEQKATLVAKDKADVLFARQTEDAAKLGAELDKDATLQTQAEQLRKVEDAQRLAAEKKRQKSVEESTAQVKPAGSANSQSVADAKTSDIGSTLLTALRLPPGARQSSRDFTYFEALPVSYDIGGGGVLLEASGSSHTRFQYVGTLGVAAEYQEFMVGGGYYLTPPDADRLTVVLLAGLEYGNFQLSDNVDQLSVDFDDTGIFLGASTRFVLNNRFEFKGGVGYSTFFDGDATIFGGGYYHINRRLDVVSRFELGDNDLLGIGVRYYY